jgi:hypothetical protein
MLAAPFDLGHLEPNPPRPLALRLTSCILPACRNDYKRARSPRTDPDAVRVRCPPSEDATQDAGTNTAANFRGDRLGCPIAQRATREATTVAMRSAPFAHDQRLDGVDDGWAVVSFDGLCGRRKVLGRVHTHRSRRRPRWTEGGSDRLGSTAGVAWVSQLLPATRRRRPSRRSPRRGAAWPPPIGRAGSRPGSSQRCRCRLGCRALPSPSPRHPCTGCPLT